jgi:transcription-repair coupling factor (superfamily II helicase)
VGFDLYCQLLKQSIAALKGEKVKPRVEVSVRLDFLEMSAVVGGEDALPAACAVKQHPKRKEAPGATHDTKYAVLPHFYIPEPQHRVEIYRKLAQATDPGGLETLARELRDRFGPLPPAVERLLQVAEVKLVAGERGVSVVEVQDDRLMLTRHGEFVMIGGKFPRLTREKPAARLKEIARLLRAL